MIESKSTYFFGSCANSFLNFSFLVNINFLLLGTSILSIIPQAMVGLLTVEARLQSELLFALKAVMKFMT